MSVSEYFPSYAVWNNKGGVGKTFLTFAMATEYARQHPDRKVVVIDMCPQANVSEIILGGGAEGASALNSCLSQSPRKTIGGYFDTRIRSPHDRTGDELDFLLVPYDNFNKEIPRNMGLIAGDPSLEIQAEAMNQLAAITLPRGSWRSVHLWLYDLIESIREKYPEVVFFTDCNPSFATYTEQALLGMNRVIVPCTADGSSARAIDNVGQLLYGINVPKEYSSANFNTRVRNAELTLPKIHMVPLNRSTQYDNKASKSFSAMYNEIKNRTYDLYCSNTNNFSSHSADDVFFDVPDAHAVSIVSSYNGLPLYSVPTGPHIIYGIKMQLNSSPLERYQHSIAAMVAKL